MNNMNPLAIEKLADTKGVIAVTEFSRKGMLANFAGSFSEDEFSLMAGMCASIAILMEMQGKLDQDFAEMVAQLCTANLAIYRIQATGWQKQTGQHGFLPERGFTFLALDHLIMGMHGKAQCGFCKRFLVRKYIL